MLLRSSGYQWQQTLVYSQDADSKATQAQSALLPHVGFYMKEFGANINPAQYGLTDLNYSAVLVGTYGLNVEYAILDFASSARLKAAKENQYGSNLSAIQYQNDLTVLMLSQYLTIQKLKKSQDAVNAAITRDQEIIRFAQGRVNAGLAVRLDLTRAQGLLAKDQVRQIEIKSQYLKACDDLALTLGQESFNCNLSALVHKPLDARYFKEFKVNESLEKRADVKASGYTASAALEMKNFAEREGLPKLQLYGQIGSVGEAAQLFGIAGTFSGLGGIQISFPLYDGGLNAGKAQAEGVRAIQADFQEKRLKLDAKFQITQSINQLQDIQLLVDLSQKNIQIAMQELAFAKRKQQLGSATGLEISNAYLNLANAHDLYIQAVYSNEMAKILFFKATGQVDKYFESDIKKDNHDSEFKNY